MKSLTRITLIILLSFGMSQVANAQKFLDKLKDKAQKKIENRLEEKMDQKMDESLDKVEESISSDDEEDNRGDSSTEKRQQAYMQNLLKGAGLSGTPVPYNTSYAFPYLIQMHIESYEKGKDKSSSSEFLTLLDPTTKNVSYEAISGDISEKTSGQFIIDSENGAMIVLNSEEKTGIVYGISSFFESIGENYPENEEETETTDNYLVNPNVKKTGKTKTIAGYECEQYTFNDEETDAEIWITNDLKVSTQDFFSTLFKTSLYSNGLMAGRYIMESKSTDKETGDTSFMTVTQVDTNSGKKISFSDYQITNLGSFTLPQEEDKN
ncbi:DUF4412 domain-containing protein [Maribellus sp. YY47]|uniref:DUF4412 domain-containing protein n=1 Tax=Maribellus sp. YY47 TaxID=2929486 RepID=UPI002001A204|nr:DUF4412 domain-containing protein [Maribellus sp. YY47]MCK3684950.1 DUF4412 domain-containing protein [Maribellus sp. YY47]